MRIAINPAVDATPAATGAAVEQTTTTDEKLTAEQCNATSHDPNAGGPGVSGRWDGAAALRCFTERLEAAVPSTNGKAQSAAARKAECETMVAAFAERIAELKERLAQTPLRDPARKTMRRSLADMRVDMADHQAECERLAPMVGAEAAETRRRRARVKHLALRAEAETTLLEQTKALDAQIANLCDGLRSFLSAIGLYVELGDVWRGRYAEGGSGVPTAQVLGDVILGRLLAAGILDDIMLPGRFVDDFVGRDELRRMGWLSPQAALARQAPMEAAGAATVMSYVFTPFYRALVAADPEHRRAEAARTAAAAEVLRQREEAEAYNLLPQGNGAIKRFG